MEKYIVPILTRIGENRYLLSIRTGMVATVPFTIIGSVFLIVSFLPVPGWESIIAPYQQMLLLPVTASFGCLSVIAALAISYDLAKYYKSDAITAALMTIVIFLMLQLNVETMALDMSKLDANGLFTAIIIAIIVVEIQRFFVNKELVIKLPENVPEAVSRSFTALTPFAVLMIGMWFIRFILGVDINAILITVFTPIVGALNTLPGFLLLIFITSLLWSVGIHGDNVLMAIAMPVALQFLAVNVQAQMAGQPLPYMTAFGFQTIFINIGGTGATFALVLMMLRSKEIGFRQLGRIAFPSACFEINEPVAFGVPIVLNPLMMIPYILAPLILTTATFLLMDFNVIGKPFVSIPWTTPPIIGHYLATGGDWRAAVWGAASIVIAFVVYFPFFKALEKQRLQQEETTTN